jgi:hypothetical protein
MSLKIKMAIIMIIVSLYAYAQAPQSFSYQAVARNTSNALLSNQNIRIRFTVHNISANGTLIYQETQSITTNQFGLFTLNVGTGTANIGDFSSINWANGAKYLQVEYDPTGGNNFVDMGATQLLSVPYALYANSAANGSGQIGATGATGATGIAGTNGINGATGEQGLRGNTGATGATGSQGIAGTNGTNGLNGATGEQGLRGNTGATGLQGATGAQGIQGIAGTNGVTGATGPQGIQGIAGTNGTNGATGSTGAQGDPATDDQTLAFNSNTNELSITGGNTITLPLNANNSNYWMYDADDRNLSPLNNIANSIYVNEGKIISTATANWQDQNGNPTTYNYISNGAYNTSFYDANNNRSLSLGIDYNNVQASAFELDNLVGYGSDLFLNKLGGRVAVGNATNPTATFEIGYNSNHNARLNIRGSQYNTSFAYDTNEDTYVRGGKASSNVYINELGNNVYIAGNNGKAAVGATGEVLNSKFTVKGIQGNSAIEIWPFTGAFNPAFNNTSVFYYNQPDAQGNNFNTYLRGGMFGSRVYLNDNNGGDIIACTNGGNVGIGTNNPTDKLSVNGSIRAKAIYVNTGWADYVFDKNFTLKSLEEVECFIEKNKHLPDIPAASEIEGENGLNVGEVNKLMMQKIEELTLYMIQANKEIKSLKSEINNLKK